MHKKHIFSRSRGQRLWMERLEERSMMAADVAAGFDDFSFDWSQFDWSQFDDSAWADWSQFEDSAWSDPAVDPATVDGSFGDQPAEGDLSWIFEQDGSDSAPAEPETPLPDAAVDDPMTTPEIVWQTTAVEMNQSPGTAIPVVTDPIADDTNADVEIGDITPLDEPVSEEVEDWVADCPLPVELEPTTVESPLSSDPSNPVADSDGWVDGGQDDTYDWSDGTNVAELETGVSDEMDAQTGEEPLPEDVVSFDPDLPVQTSVPSVDAAAPRQTGFSARAAAFGAMRMFPGFSFGGSTDSSDDGPIFAGGRRRSRR